MKFLAAFSLEQTLALDLPPFLLGVVCILVR